jgi:hypothetical protein
MPSALALQRSNLKGSQLFGADPGWRFKFDCRTKLPFRTGQFAPDLT